MHRSPTRSGSLPPAGRTADVAALPLAIIVQRPRATRRWTPIASPSARPAIASTITVRAWAESAPQMVQQQLVERPGGHRTVRRLAVRSACARAGRAAARRGVAPLRVRDGERQRRILGRGAVVHVQAQASLIDTASQRARHQLRRRRRPCPPPRTDWRPSSPLSSAPDAQVMGEVAQGPGRCGIPAEAVVSARRSGGALG